MEDGKLCDGGYYKIFNEDNVELVHLKENPIKEFNKTGIVTSDGKQHDFDAIIFATGFDAMDANYMRVSIKGSVPTLTYRVTNANRGAVGVENLYRYATFEC